MDKDPGKVDCNQPFNNFNTECEHWPSQIISRGNCCGSSGVGKSIAYLPARKPVSRNCLAIVNGNS